MKNRLGVIKYIFLLLTMCSATAYAENYGLQKVIYEQITNPNNTAVGIIFTNVHPSYGYYSYIGQGSGFVISSDGVIATNHHVIENADNGLIKLGNRHLIIKEIIYEDSQHDIALLKVDTKGLKLPTVKLGSAKNEKIGNIICIISSPLGFENDIQCGKILYYYLNYPVTISIKTTAISASGASGGPAFNGNGEVIGILKQVTLDIPIGNATIGKGILLPIDLLTAKISNNATHILNKEEKLQFINLITWRIFINMPDNLVFFWSNFFIEEDKKYCLICSKQEQEAGRENGKYCTYRYGGKFCVEKEDVISVAKNENP